MATSDSSYLSAIYHGTKEKFVKLGLDTYFDKHTLILNKDGSVYNDDETNLVYIAGQLERIHISPFKGYSNEFTLYSNPWKFVIQEFH